MPRISVKTPSNGKPVSIRLANVSTSWTTIAEAPDFSVLDTSNVYPDRDPSNTQRAIRPGEVFILTPLRARNKTATARWLEVRLLTEDGVAIECPGILTVPPGETWPVPLQGYSLLKRVAAGANGDRLQVRAQAANTFDVWGAAQERPSSEHIGPSS